MSEHQDHQVSLGEDDEYEEDEEEDLDLDKHGGVWENAPDYFMTDYPPPEGFDGHEDGRYGDYAYRRELTEEEEEAYREIVAAEQAELRAEGEAYRLAFFFRSETGDEAGEPAAAEDAADDPG